MDFSDWSSRNGGIVELAIVGWGCHQTGLIYVATVDKAKGSDHENSRPICRKQKIRKRACHCTYGLCNVPAIFSKFSVGALTSKMILIKS
jgi:hypothetical protein